MNDQTVGYLLHLAHQVAGDQHGASLVGELAQQSANPPDAVEVQPVDRLVEQQHARVADQRRRDPETLPHAQRVALDPTPGRTVEPDPFDHLVHPACRDAVRPGGHAEVAASGAPVVCRAGVEQRADLPERFGERLVRTPVHECRPRGGQVEAEHDPHGGGLAGAVRPEEPGDLARFDVEAQVVHGQDVAVASRQAAHLDHSCPSSSPSSTHSSRSPG
jgi:hypothetical protein